MKMFGKSIVDEGAFPELLGEVGPTYKVVQIGVLAVVEPFLNYAHEQGYRLHTLRDGLTSGAMKMGDVGYRLVLEKYR